MADSANLALPYIAASQAQKHVTHNEALRLLDGIVQMSVKDRHLAAPPGSPAEGVRYIVAGSASGAWAGWTGSVAMWVDGAWYRMIPRIGWFCWIEDESLAVVWTGSAWTPWSDAVGLIARAAAVTVAQGPAGFGTGVGVLEQNLTGLSGATRDSTVLIPNRAIVLGVTSRVTTAITGATSFGCGIAGEATKFGGTLGIASGSTNIGVIGPTAFYADTPVRLTADGGNFTGGAVRIAIHYLLCAAP
ncbi:MAG TPA: DUF2793 domain-containing protein [Novosphingobium sp.]|jgi:hypothetical protein|nr:DUF2793 domain-containing protein [Novosphingobium sp.]